MGLELSQLFLIGLGYLLLLFGIAHITDRGLLPEKILHHPATYVLSLGVFTSAWAIYGVTGLAYEFGYGFMAYYLGLAGAFIFAPLVLTPLLRLCRRYMHGSLADLLTFRYRSQWVGSLATLFMLMAILPLLALQIQAVSDTVQMLSASDTSAPLSSASTDKLAIIFCIGIGIFTISFGSRQLTAHQRHNGLVAAIAFESIIKLLAMLSAGAVAVFGVFGGPAELELWLQSNPAMLDLLNNPQHAESARVLLLIFFSAAVAMPHLFHMTFAENPSLQAMRTAGWGIPLFLLLMSLPVLPILWAGFKLQTQLPSEYFTLAIGIELNSPALAIFTFVGGLSAASGAIIVITLAMASMCLKHLVLPIYRPGTERDIYRWLLWIRRLLIIFIIFAGYAFYKITGNHKALSSLGMAAFISTLQFLPAVLASLYWQKANSKGLIAGLCTGTSIWFISLLLPLISDFNPASWASQQLSLDLSDIWGTVTIISIGCNSIVFVLVSLLTRSSPEARAAAAACATDALTHPTRQQLSISNPQEMAARLATALGQRTADREVNAALKAMDLAPNETRPLALRRLRYRIEANLSALLGPSVAHTMVDQLLPFEKSDDEGNQDINLIEVRLENYKTHLTGLAADLDNLRRYHRQTLQDLPVGVCSLGQDLEVLMWNHSLAELTGISTFEVTGSHLNNLPPPWAEVFLEFIQSPEPHRHKLRIDIDSQPRWINLHKTTLSEGGGHNGRVIVLEDATEVQLLEDELVHSERLASIGRLAAGVAHEIGNPITGIACLAQNLRYDTDNPDSLETAREILVQTERVSKIVQTLVNFAHAGAEGARHKPQPVCIKDCADEAIKLLQLNKDAKEIEFANLCDPFLHALADSQRLLQVFVNLLSNARDASPEYSCVTIDCEDRYENLHISVTDQGSGIKPEHQEQIFEPFFTTKEAGQGTGLGLSLVYSIIEDLKGHIHVISPADPFHGGTRFVIQLPQYRGEHRPEYPM